MLPTRLLPCLGRVAPLAVLLSLCGAPRALAQFDNRWVAFDDETASRLQVAPSAVSDPETEVDFAWADLDQDGWVDLIVVRKEAFTNPGKRPDLLLMNRNGVLTDETALYASAADIPGDQGFLTPTNDRDVTVTDVDLDGWTDVVSVPVLGHTEPKHINHPRVYRNLGNGSSMWQGLRFEDARIPQLFVYGSGLPAGANSCGIAAGDVTDDGFDDLYLVHYDQGAGPTKDLNDRLLVNDGFGYFADSSQASLTAQMLSSAFGTSGRILDMNGDGANDIVRSQDGPVHVTYNNPANVGAFNIFHKVYGGGAYHMAADDLNNDARIDLVVTDDAVDTYLYNLGNDALGRVIWSAKHHFDFLFGQDDLIGGNSLIVDLDGDGWRDVIICDVDVDIGGCVRRTHIYHNPGGTAGEQLALREEREGPGTGWVGAVGILFHDLTGGYDVAAFDIDNDLDKDLVLGRCSGTNVWINDPNGGSGVTCQQDLGFATDPDLVMSVCGGDLSAGTSATLVLSNVPLFSTVVLFLSTQFQPTFVWELQGSLVTVPPIAVVAFPGFDNVVIPNLPGGGGPATFYLQAVVDSILLPRPLLSNALRVDLLP